LYLGADLDLLDGDELGGIRDEVSGEDIGVLTRTEFLACEG
jgi:hypothetical protein